MPKVGLDYFSFDIDFFSDEKIEFVSARFGMKGEIVTIKLLCKIYRNGYFAQWGEDETILFAKRAGENITPACVNEIIGELVKRGFFNKALFDKFEILTSVGIQKRYFEAVERRKEVEFHPEFMLVNHEKMKNVNISVQNVYIPPENVDISKQSKVKESKVKKKDSPVFLQKTGSEDLAEDFKKVDSNDARAVRQYLKTYRSTSIDPYIAYWNLFAEKYSRAKVKEATSARKRKLATRLTEQNFDFCDVLELAGKSDFVKAGNWFSFDWVIENPGNYLKMLEGNYAVKAAAPDEVPNTFTDLLKKLKPKSCTVTADPNTRQIDTEPSNFNVNPRSGV